MMYLPSGTAPNTQGRPGGSTDPFAVRVGQHVLDIVNRQSVFFDVLDVAARFLVPDDLLPHDCVLLTRPQPRIEGTAGSRHLSLRFSAVPAAVRRGSLHGRTPTYCGCQG